MFDTPPTEVLVNAEKFFQHYKSEEMQNYGRWCYAILSTVASYLQPFLNNTYYENLTANNEIINKFLAKIKEAVLKKDIKDFVGLDLAKLKTYLDEIQFFELFKIADMDAAAFESIKENMTKAFYNALLTASIVSNNYSAFALCADLGLLDVCTSVKSSREVKSNWDIDKIAQQNIYAAIGPRAHGFNYYKNINYFITLMELKITNVVAIGKGNSDFLDYKEPHEFNGTDANGNTFKLSIEPQLPLGTSLRVENGLTQASDEWTPYFSFPIEIKKTDSSGNETVHQLMVHNIQAQDGSAFQLSDETLKNLVQQLNSAVNKENILVHCQAGLGRTGHFIALWLLARLNKLTPIFSSDNNSEIAAKYKEFIAELRQSRPRLVSTAPQVWAALEQALQLLRTAPQLFAEQSTSSSTTGSSSSSASTATTLVPESAMTPPHTPTTGQERGDPTIDMLIQSGGSDSDDGQDSESDSDRCEDEQNSSGESYAKLITKFTAVVNPKLASVATEKVIVAASVALGSTPPKNA